MTSHPPSPGPQRGRLVVICGCMFSGKTTRLIEHLQRAVAGGRTAIAFKHDLDARYDAEQLATHDGRLFPARTIAAARLLTDLGRRGMLLGVDEIHFFGPEVVPVMADLLDGGVDLVVAGIDHNAWGQPFTPMPQLKAMAASIEWLSSPCTLCGRPALFSQRITPIVNGNMVGGPGDYAPRCAACFVPLPGSPDGGGAS